MSGSPWTARFSKLWDGLFNRRPYLYTWERRWWTVTTPWNFDKPFLVRLGIAIRWKMPRWMGGWSHRGRRPADSDSPLRERVEQAQTALADGSDEAMLDYLRGDDRG